MKKESLIIGGGFSGLAAGVGLASHGHHVTLIERKSHLGGRAYSYQDPVTGSTLDNGQHVLMGCYKDTLSFLETIGTRKKVSFQKDLLVDLASPGHPPARFKALRLPSPLHLLGGFLSFSAISWKERFGTFRMGRALKGLDLKKLDKRSIPDWLG